MMIERQYLDIKPDQRVIIMSDVHGNLDLVKKALDQVQFNSKDVLIFNGDVAEKGFQIIALFEYLLELKKTYQVHVVLGNCDHLINHFCEPQFNEGMSVYMNSRKRTFLAELGKIMGGHSSYEERVLYAQKHYAELIEWVHKFPLVLETPYFICTHAAYSEDFIERRFNTSTPNFFRSEAMFNKPVLVGHYPVCLYSDDEINHNTRFDFKRNIISADGANMMKVLGQINIVIFEHGEFSSQYVDELKYIKAPYAQKEQKGTHINWANNGIEVRSIGDEYSEVFHPYSGNLVTVANHFLNLEDLSLEQDTTDTLLEINEGDLIHVHLETSKGYYIKAHGKEGWLLKI